MSKRILVLICLLVSSFIGIMSFYKGNMYRVNADELDELKLDKVCKVTRSEMEKKDDESYYCEKSISVQKSTYVAIRLFVYGDKNKCGFKILDSDGKKVDSCSENSKMWKKDGMGYSLKGSITKKLKEGNYKLVLFSKKLADYNGSEARIEVTLVSLPAAGKITNIQKSKNNKLLIKWKKNKEKGIKGYIVERATKKNGTYYMVSDVKGNKTKTTIDMRDYAKNVKYYYRVRAYRKMKDDEELIYSSGKSITPKIFTWKE